MNVTPANRPWLVLAMDLVAWLSPAPGAAFTVELKAGSYRYEWFDPSKGTPATLGNLQASGQTREFKPPFNGDAVLHLKAVH